MSTQKQEKTNKVQNQSKSLTKQTEQPSIAQEAALEAMVAESKQREENEKMVKQAANIALWSGLGLVLLLALPAVLIWVAKVLNSAEETRRAWRKWKQRA